MMKKRLTPLLKSIEPRAIKCLAEWDGTSPPQVDINELMTYAEHFPIVNLWTEGYLLYAVLGIAKEGEVIKVKVPTKQGFITLSAKVMTKGELREFVNEVERFWKNRRR